MKITRFQADDLHGYLSFMLELRPGLTFLTGINGSGKTSAVRAITALLTPSIRALCNMSYGRLSVTVVHLDVEITVSSQRSDEELFLHCTSQQGPASPLRIPLLKRLSYETDQRYSERQLDFYREQEAINAKHSVLVAIEQIPTPMFLDLERRYQDGKRPVRGLSRHRIGPAPANPLAGSLSESLSDAEILAEESFREFQRSRSRLTEQLKQDLILAAFRGPSDIAQMRLSDLNPQFDADLDNIQKMVTSSLDDIGIVTHQRRHIDGFFDNVRSVAAQVASHSPLHSKMMSEELMEILGKWSALQPQLAQVRYIANRVARHNMQINEIYGPVANYLSWVNRFLSDSGKRLGFNEFGYLRAFVRARTAGNTERNVAGLSSGEKQLVVILTHLVFNDQAGKANVLIIDEPELSLHLRWQEIFVDTVVAASPDLQLILATHSPSIIMGRVSDCTDVQEARDNAGLLS